MIGHALFECVQAAPVGRVIETDTDELDTETIAMSTLPSCPSECAAIHRFLPLRSGDPNNSASPTRNEGHTVKRNVLSGGRCFMSRRYASGRA